MPERRRRQAARWRAPCTNLPEAGEREVRVVEHLGDEGERGVARGEGRHDLARVRRDLAWSGSGLGVRGWGWS